MSEAWPVSLYPQRFRSDEARMQALARTARLLGELEAAVRRELGADRIPLDTAVPAGTQAQAGGGGTDRLCDH